MRSCPRRVVIALLVVASWVGLAGCQPNENLPFASEVDEPHYWRCTQLLRGGRSQEALEVYVLLVPLVWQMSGMGISASSLRLLRLNTQKALTRLRRKYYR
jgi:hypothetical protein